MTKIHRSPYAILLGVNFVVNDHPKSITEIANQAVVSWRQASRCLGVLIQLGVCKAVILPGYKCKRYVLPSWSLFVEDPKSKAFNPNDSRHGSCEDCGIGLHKTKNGVHCSGYRFAGCFTPKDKVVGDAQ